MTERTNEEWLDDLQAADPRRAEALADLRARLARGIFFYLRRDRSDLNDRTTEDLEQLAEDFTQDALLKILENLDGFRGESKFTTWASKIAVRVAISELRRVRWKNYSLDELTFEGESKPDLAALSIAPDEGPAPENQAERQEALHLIDEALGEVLTDRQRTALLAYIVDGVNVEEIARRMDTNRNALYKLVHDARLKLKRHMELQGYSLDYLLGLFEDR